ncbi:MAG TPA: two-component regulator propeller domain-containing protein [Azospirillum sp.]|nr:two-component regulator propeller domain-containing protein [Azospirillum sp.]
MRNVLLVAGIALAAAAGAYELGRQQAPPPVPAAAQTQAAPALPAPPPVPPAQAAAPAAPSTPPLPAQHPAPRDFDHFRVGNRNVKALAVDGGTLWVGSSGGVIRYDIANDKFVVYDNKNGLLSNGIFHVHRHGDELWVGTYGGGLSVMNVTTGVWRGYNVPEGMGDAFVYDVMRARSGDIWIATWSGVNRIKGGRMDDIDAWELHTVASTGGGLPNDWVYGLAEGANGEVWLATEGGVARFVGGAWENWTHAKGLGAPYDAVKAQIDLTNDPGNQSRHHAQQKKEQGLENVSVAYNPNYVISIAVDAAGGVWAGTWGGGLSYFDGTAWRTYTVSDGLPSNHIFMLKRAPDGVLWIGTNRGLSRYDGKAFSTITEKDGLLGNSVFSMAFAGNGEVWVGSFGGLTRFRKGL